MAKGDPMRNKESRPVPRLMIAGTGSGSGKTTVTCALLLVLQKQGFVPAAFKGGPDYVDPMFHSRVLGVPSRNLDLFLCGEEDVPCLLARNAKVADIAVIEGVMGLYDGLGQSNTCSSNHLATVTATPEILVVSPKGQGLSLVAQLYGYLHFLPNTIKGVILNKVSAKMYTYYKSMIKEHLGLRLYGYLPLLPEAEFASRKLGLAPPGEIEGIQTRLYALATVAEQTLDIDGLLELSRQTAPLEYCPVRIEKQCHVTLAVARDEAFCFYYEDGLELLRLMGAKTVFFSPLHDGSLPEGCSGVLIGGGYPEEHAPKLSDNVSMRASIRGAIDKGLPVMAEGGGYLYLCRSLKTLDGEEYPMVGGVEAEGFITPSLQRFGYSTLTASSHNMFCEKGETLRAHEYHYGDSSDNGNGFTAQKNNGTSWPAVHAQGNLFAGLPQIHFWGNKNAALKFLQTCAQYKARQQW